ncbi:MAG: creatininase family protein [Roseovarius sp.]|nr:creatininase family protein [Roseovarius sp.]MCY4206334.1 creatininase family protein [Roseovarius sp.]MCY4290331.1 creatininase family protein [Roseovarius sp.]
MSVVGYWSELKSSDFKNLPAGTIAILPIGAIEQHGPHLPLSVDCDLVDAVVRRTLKRLGESVSVLVLPFVSIGKSDEHLDYPGTLTLSAETMLAVLRETGASVARAGVERIVLLNGHGGNAAVLQIAARELRRNQNMIAAVCAWSAFSSSKGLFGPGDRMMDIHGGDSETSAMLAVRSDLVDMTMACDFRASNSWNGEHVGLAGQPASPGWIMSDLNPAGACGNAAAATVEKGDALLESASRNFAKFLAEFSRYDHRKGIS